MNERRGEKWGWLGGWLGGFVWVLLLSLVLIGQGRTLQAAVGGAIVGLAIGFVVGFSPWRFPRTPYRLLMTPIYLLFLGSLAWGIWVSVDLHQLLFANPWSWLVMLPLLLPWWTVGNRRWEPDAE